jgi:hypothetical protein
MHVNYKQPANRSSVPESTTCVALALTGGPLCEPHVPDKRQPRRADGAVVLRSSIMGLTRLLGVMLILTSVLAVSQFPTFAAGSVTLTWNPSTDSNVTGYRIYNGVASRNYTNIVDTGDATSVTVSNLAEGTTHFFAATAYNILGMESEFSDEISYTVPGTIPGALAKLQLRVSPTRQVVLTVTGQVGRIYNIQASADFITWTAIGTALVPAGGSLNFIDTNAASFPKRFYRAQ